MGYAERAPHTEEVTGGVDALMSDELRTMRVRDIAVAGLVGVDRETLRPMMDTVAADITADEVPERALAYLVDLIEQQLPVAEREARHIMTVERVEAVSALARSNGQLQSEMAQKDAELRASRAVLQRAEMIENALAEVRAVLVERAPETIPILDKALAPKLELVEDDHEHDPVQKVWTLDHLLEVTFGERVGSRLSARLARFRATLSS